MWSRAPLGERAAADNGVGQPGSPTQENIVAVRVQPPPSLQCPRCNGVMFREAADAFDYLCLFCGEYKFLVPTKASLEPLPPPEAFQARRGRPKRIEC
jgi:hypothetical protein